MGAQYLSWNYDQMGVVATLHLAEETHNTTAWQRFLPTGPVALLPLDSTRSSLVWSTTLDHAKDLLRLPEEQFVDALNDALWKQYPRSSSVDACMSWLSSALKKVGLPDGAQRQLPPSIMGIAAGSRAAFPLGFGHSTRYVAHGVALVGDAAHRVHPLAGQGVNLGFGDVKDLTELLANALYSGLDTSHHSWLEKYESVRQRHNVPTQLAVDALHRLYTVDSPPLVLARSLGLQLTNALQPLKVPPHSQYESVPQRHNVPTQLAVDALHRLYTVDSPPLVLARSLGLQLTNALQPLKVPPHSQYLRILLINIPMEQM
ncbi:hypothetical protein O0L34_g794 [Tuta absoluta]|nr:hypothetical protein O0L34_g794 [Tuta absoluta]